MQSKPDDKLSKKIFEAIVHSAFISGHIKEEDLKDRVTLLDKVKKICIDKEADFHFIIDHRDEILSAIEIFLVNDKIDFAIIFYAMYFEHTINSIIATILRTRKISNKSISEVIRNAHSEAKFTWLLELLGLPKFNEKHKKIISEISSQRNAFIHYKFLPKTEHKGDSDKINELIKSAKKSVTYIKKYESQILYKRKKNQLKKIFK